MLNRPQKLRKGDRVAIVSLSKGILGEEFCSHNLEIPIFDSLAKHNTSQSRYLQGLRGILVSF